MRERSSDQNVGRIASGRGAVCRHPFRVWRRVHGGVLHRFVHLFKTSKRKNIEIITLSLAGKITSARHTKSFYLVAASTLTWFLVAQPIFDFADIDIAGLLHLSQVGSLSNDAGAKRFI